MFEELYYSEHLHKTGDRRRRVQHLVDTKKEELIRSFQFKSSEDKYKYIESRAYLPKDNYELWNPYDFVNSARVEMKKIKQKKKQKKRKLEDGEDYFDELNNESDDADEEEVSLENETSTAEEKDSDLTSQQDLRESKKYEKFRTEMIIKGYEFAPLKLQLANTDVKRSSVFTDIVSFSRYQVNILSNILHVTVLRKQWEQAKTSFALLLRMDNVEIRSIWPLGLEILQRLEEENLKEAASLENISLNSYQLRVLTNYPKDQQLLPFLVELEDQNRAKLQELIKKANSNRVEKFLTWLRNYYGINITKISTKLPLFWRTGARKYVPMYFRSLVWNLLLKFDFRNCKDLLQDLILLQPFNNDGGFHYYLGLCHQIEASYCIDLNLSSPKEIVDLLRTSLKYYYLSYRNFKIDISYQILNDLKKSFIAVGVQNADELFRAFKESVDDEDIEHSQIMKELAIISTQTLSSAIIESDSDRDSDSSSLSSGQDLQSDFGDKYEVAKDLEALNLSPISQTVYSPPSQISSKFNDDRHRHREAGIDNVIDFEDDMHLAFDSDDSILSSD